MITFKPTAANLFFTKNDPQDLRLGDIVRPASLESATQYKGYGICGYADHEGIALNGGRTGAAEAPARIRQFLYKMTPPSLTTATNTLHDFGDLTTEQSLDARHLAAEEAVFKMQTAGLCTLSFGGGHDYGFPDASAFLRAHLNRTQQQPVVINFDAHLDVRPVTNGHHSGTPFYRLLRQFGGQFRFAEIGLQPQCNSPAHRQWAKEQGAHLVDLKDVCASDGLSALLNQKFFSTLTQDTPVFISFDIDSLCSAEAPGCSQSWTTGLKLQDYLKFFSSLNRKCDIRGLGIYEVSPPLDIDNLTSKAAALIAYNYLFAGEL